MTLRLEELITIYPDELYLEVSPQEREEAWLQTQNYLNKAVRWNVYLNLLALKRFVAYLQEEPDLKKQPLLIEFNDVSASSDSWHSSVWQFFNGTAIKLGNTRLVIIPEEVSDTDVLCVPQEWVDISNWAADYYIGMQVNLEDGWLRVYGYATHRQLKERGKYDRMERTYSLNEDDLIEDLNAMWVASELCPSEKAEIAPLPTLFQSHAENLLLRLGKLSAYFPRLDIPFGHWAALLVNDEWRQKLYQYQLPAAAAQSSGTPTVSKILVQLRQWLEQDFVDALNAGWQQITRELLDTASLSSTNLVRSGVHSQDEFTRLQAAEQLGLVDPNDLDAINTLLELLETSQEQWICQKAAETLGLIDPSNPKAAVSMQKPIVVNHHPVSLIAAFRPILDQTFAVRLEVRSSANQTYLPLGLKLVVSSGSESIELPAEEIDSYLELLLPEVKLGDQFSVQVILDDTPVTEDFVI